MKKTVIDTPKAPSAIGPYSQAIKTDTLVFISGQIPIDPETGALAGDSIESQTRQVLNNLRAIAEEAGGSLDHIVKTTIYLTDLSFFSTVNGIYSDYFTAAPPARATVQVAALPLGSAIEIDAIMQVG